MSPRESLPGKCQFLLAVALCTAEAFAQTQVAVSERDYFEELPVVLSVSRLAQPLDEAPGAVTVIDREMIRLSGVRDLMDLFRLVPGFQVAKPPSGAGIVTYHGLGESYPRGMQVLLDGRSMYSPFFYGGVNWNLIPVALDDIERIEVVRGSNSASYGANAFLGIANIVTRHASEGHGVTAEVREGNQGVHDRFLRLGGGSATNVRVSALSQQDDGIVTQPDHIGKRLFDARADIRLGLRDELQLQAGTLDVGLQVGTVGKAGDPSRLQQLRHQFVSLGWRRALDEFGELAVRYYRAEESGADAFTWLAGGMTFPIDYGFRSQRDDLEVQHTFRPWPDARLVWGGELRSDIVSGKQFYGTTEPVRLGLGRIFGNLEWRLHPAWVANVGGTIERDSNTGTSAAPRLALNWHVAPGQTLRAGISGAFRSPSLFESRGYGPVVATNGLLLGYYYFQRDKLVPERLISREIGWLGEFRPINLTADLRVFAEQVNGHMATVQTTLTAPYCPTLDPLCAAASSTAPSSYNMQDVSIRGLEYQVRWQPAARTRVILNQAFVRMSQQLRLPDNPLAVVTQIGQSTSEIINMQIQAAASAPTRNLSLMLMQTLPGGLELSATYSSVGALKWTQNDRISGYKRLDWRLAYPFRVGPTRGELAFAVQGDGAKRTEYRSFNVMSTRGYATLRLDY
ncbi:MAG: TonB-dependent receptor [Rhodocyclales bacterium]|nr:TonB-dependent receptor [Rhodocyclales bacterium]